MSVLRDQLSVGSCYAYAYPPAPARRAEFNNDEPVATATRDLLKEFV